MRSRPNTGFGFLVVGIILFLGCRSMYQGGGSASTSGTDFASTGNAGSFFAAVQIDPRSEDSAGPVFADAGDLDGDGLMDIASAWNESQPIQIHLQRRNADGDIAFMTLPLGGTAPIATVAGLEVVDMDGDTRPDVVVLIKDTGQVATCDPSREDCDVTENGGVLDEAIEGGIMIFFNPADASAHPWHATLLNTSFLAGREEGSSLEEGGYTSMAIGDIDGINGPDIVVAFNSAEGDPELPLNAPEGLPQANTIDFWPNPGADRARIDDAWIRSIIYEDLPAVGACRILDVDRDGDLDVVCTYPDAKSTNVRWVPNPLDLGEMERVYELWGRADLAAPVGQVHPGANSLEIGDLDGDGLEDVLVRSAKGQIVQWFKRPAFPAFDFIRSPWQVYTLAEFRERKPQSMAIGDLTGDGQVEVVIGAEGAVAWFDSTRTISTFDQWAETLLIDDAPPGEESADPAIPSITDILQVLTDPTQVTQEEATVTLVNSLLVADIDGDGNQDIVGTLDRVDGSGLTNDALILFENRRP